MYHSLGLKSDGTIVTWGDNSYHQREVPFPNMGFIKIAAGGYNSIGVRKEFNTTADVLRATDGSLANLDCSIVSAAWGDAFYVESDDRSSGIRVEKLSHGLIDGKRTNVAGKIMTNSDGERYIQALAATHAGTGAVEPLGMINKSLGDDGLNNVGLLVRTWGRIIEFEPIELPTWFIIDDGSGVDVRCEAPAGVTINKTWTFVTVTGISRLYKIGDTFHRRISIRKTDDISPLEM
jgi:hypothetical protein